MAKMVWDQMAEKFFEGGCSKGVCFTDYDKSSDTYTHGEAWNGVSGFTDNPSGADEQASYADNIKYISLRGAENYGGTIKCFWYPDNFRKCLGKKAAANGVTVSQQGREAFGFAVTTQVGNDVDGTEAGETIHLVWNATTSPSSKDYSSLNESPSPSELSFEFTANPVAIGDGTKFKASCNMEICTVGREENQTFQTGLTALKKAIYGDDPTYSSSALGSKPDDWDAATGVSDKYFTRTGSAAPYTYTPVDFTGTAGTVEFTTDTYYEKINDGDAYLPSPAAVITMFGGSVTTVNAEG